MKTDYLCPFCKSHLVCCNNLILTIESQEGEKRGLIMLNYELGNYAYINHPSLQFREGEVTDFFCPVCGENLKVPEINDHLVRLIMLDEQGKPFDVYFSRIAGEQSTFKIDQEDVIEQYGKDASAYVSYFTAKMKKQLHT